MIDAILKWILEAEGAWSDHPSDPGGPTFCGIASEYHPKPFEQLRQLRKETTSTLDDLAVQYWYYKLGKPSPYTDLELMRKIDEILLPVYRSYLPPFEAPFPLTLSYYDTAFLQGHRTATKILQQALNSQLNLHLLIDGILGPKTRKALSQANLSTLHYFYNPHRLEHLTHSNNFSIFGRGWVRRVANLQLYLEVNHG